MADIHMNVLAEVCKSFPARQSILVRGAHGIGKSALAQMLGRTFNIPVIDLRLSQMTEGDFLGLPKLFDPQYDEHGTLIAYGRTEFMPPDWFVQASSEPVVLLLDEINRATPELMQCGFQLIYDRMIQGKKLHPETRIVACVNASHHYQVNEMDPALLNRFWTCDLVPTLSDWLKWAREEGGIDSSIIEFCKQNKQHWWHNPKGGLEPGKIYPTPRGWDMLNSVLIQERDDGTNLFDNPTSPLFRHAAVGLVGDEAGMAFFDFVKNYDRQISAEQVLDEYKTVRSKITAGMSAEGLGTIIDKLVDHCSDNAWTKKQVKNVVQFMQDMDNKEFAFALWTRVTTGVKSNEARQKNMRLMHKEARSFLLDIMGQSTGTA